MSKDSDYYLSNIPTERLQKELDERKRRLLALDVLSKIRQQVADGISNEVSVVLQYNDWHCFLEEVRVAGD